ncbi:hypothetical protein TRFO_29275 [Tritrichomonas foetus]|uniref:Bromo domain-containing protein n=1 Tax=Tritrichomonas foetus TaxID=1144522 RepID=A0A1J4JXG4_9EUKA|nr:hypothetical protein TRFO_29275 [Tritrichomonas foetus]|eukprot:OHT03354.1 hypothetical protein TRFO_29275 [Tritrichomonas foetus]
MNKHQQSSCLKIMEELEANACYQMFNDPPNILDTRQIERPIFFKFIKTKVERGMYNSTGEFVFDVRTLFRNVLISNSNKFRMAGAKLLSQIFEDLLARGSITNTQQENTILTISHSIDESLLSIPIPQPNHLRSKWMPGAAIFQEKVLIPTNEQLQADLKILHFPNVIVQAAIFASKIQQDSVLFGQSIQFLFSKMNDQTKIELHKFIMKKLREIAVMGH